MMLFLPGSTLAIVALSWFWLAGDLQNRPLKQTILKLKKLNQLHAVSRTRQGGRRNIVWRHSVPHFLPNSGDIACWVAELNAAFCLDTRAKKCKYMLCNFIRLRTVIMLSSHGRVSSVARRDPNEPSSYNLTFLLTSRPLITFSLVFFEDFRYYYFK